MHRPGSRGDLRTSTRFGRDPLEASHLYQWVLARCRPHASFQGDPVVDRGRRAPLLSFSLTYVGTGTTTTRNNNNNYNTTITTGKIAVRTSLRTYLSFTAESRRNAPTAMTNQYHLILFSNLREKETQ